jgi:hypothetical protein
MNSYSVSKADMICVLDIYDRSLHFLGTWAEQVECWWLRMLRSATVCSARLPHPRIGAADRHCNTADGQAQPAHDGLKAQNCCVHDCAGAAAAAPDHGSTLARKSVCYEPPQPQPPAPAAKPFPLLRTLPTSDSLLPSFSCFLFYSICSFLDLFITASDVQRMAGCEFTGTAAAPSHHTAMETVDVAAWASLSLCYIIGSSMDKTPAEE